MWDWVLRIIESQLIVLLQEEPLHFLGDVVGELDFWQVEVRDETTGELSQEVPVLVGLMLVELVRGSVDFDQLGLRTLLLELGGNLVRGLSLE